MTPFSRLPLSVFAYEHKPIGLRLKDGFNLLRGILPDE